VVSLNPLTKTELEGKLWAVSKEEQFEFNILERALEEKKQLSRRKRYFVKPTARRGSASPPRAQKKIVDRVALKGGGQTAGGGEDLPSWKSTKTLTKQKGDFAKDTGGQRVDCGETCLLLKGRRLRKKDVSR